MQKTDQNRDRGPAVTFKGVAKKYLLYPTLKDRVLDSVGLSKFIPWRKIEAREFWALKGIDIALARGERLGVIGRNGAGKTTLLKLITGNYDPSEGSVSVHGTVQALLEVGTGFHPQFTGRENVIAALKHLTLTDSEQKAVLRDISEFTELGEFLDQPFRTYSAGMKSRLTFAAATAIQPDILIIDEMLGAGDAYFAAKSVERMKNLVASGDATVILVSHSMADVLRYCDKVIWIERGTVKMSGPAIEVVNSYEEYIHAIEHRRLSASNATKLGELEGESSYATLKLTISPNPEGSIDGLNIHSVSVSAGGDEYLDVLKVGGVQDIDASHSCWIEDSTAWTNPCSSGEATQRRGVVGSDARVAFSLPRYSIQRGDIVMTLSYSGSGRCSVSLDDELLEDDFGLPESSVYTDFTLTLPVGVGDDTKNSGKREKLSHWASKKSGVRVCGLQTLNANRKPTAQYQFRETIVLLIEVECNLEEDLQILPVAVVSRIDGIIISKMAADRPFHVNVEAGEKIEFELTIDDPCMLDGEYMFSVAIFDELRTQSARYDLVSRAASIRVVGAPKEHAGALISLTSRWKTIDSLPS